MARAYICLARGDIDNNNLQILDLQPNSSLRVPAYEGAGQTGYLAWAPQNSTMVAHTNDGGVLRATGTYYGLATYLAARLDNQSTGFHLCVTAANANTIATAILARVVAGSALTTAGINAAVQVTLVNSGIGVAGTQTTATVEEILRIVSGEVFKVTAGDALSGAAGITLGTAGAFVAPVTGATGIITYPTDWRHVRTFVDTGSLHLSRHSGHMSKLAAATMDWNNPAYTYGAAGTALWVDATHLLTHVGRVLVVYDATGAVIS